MAANHQNNWTCPNCGTVNNNAFCRMCGLPRPMETNTVLCSCGFQNIPEARFCGNCGRQLTGAQPVKKEKKKRPIGIFAVLFIALAVLVGCMVKIAFSSHTHQWENATCTVPKFCSVCGETSGTSLGHTWEEATCTTPRTCTVCGETEGSPLEHDWVEATCTISRYCRVCKASSGTPLGHKWKEATTTAPKTCTVCGETKGEKLKSGYVGTPSGRTEKTTLRDGSFTLNIHAFVLNEAVKNCKELTVDMSVEMKAGTKCQDWQLWGRSNGSFRKIGKIYLPNGDGDTCQTLTFDTPVSFDAVVVTPTIPGDYSWSLWFEITDVWVDS